MAGSAANPFHDLRPALWVGAMGPPGAWLALQMGLQIQEAACSPLGYLTLLAISPLLEEFVFRVGLQAWLLQRWRQRLGPLSLANSIVALVFGCMHLWHHATVAAMLTMLPALLIGWAWESCRQRLGVAVALHAWFNACLVLLSCLPP